MLWEDIFQLALFFYFGLEISSSQIYLSLMGVSQFCILDAVVQLAGNVIFIFFFHALL